MVGVAVIDCVDVAVEDALDVDDAVAEYDAEAVADAVVVAVDDADEDADPDDVTDRDAVLVAVTVVVELADEESVRVAVDEEEAVAVAAEGRVWGVAGGRAMGCLHPPVRVRVDVSDAVEVEVAEKVALAVEEDVQLAGNEAELVAVPAQGKCGRCCRRISGRGACTHRWK